jgi:hypothetical protein
MDAPDIGFLFLIVGIVVIIGIAVEVAIRRSDRRHSMAPVVRIDGIEVPARVDPKTGQVSTDAPVRPGQTVQVSYTTTEDP